MLIGYVIRPGPVVNLSAHRQRICNVNWKPRNAAYTTSHDRSCCCSCRSDDKLHRVLALLESTHPETR